MIEDIHLRSKDLSLIDYHAAYFADDEVGWVVGEDGAIMHTIDGGKNWREQESGTRELLNGVRFLEDSNEGWAVGVKGEIIHTTNGGIKWSEQESHTTELLKEVYCPLGEWEKNPRLQAKTLVCLRYGTLQEKQSYRLRYKISPSRDN